MDNKTLFKEYEKWCVENNKDPLKEETVSEFKLIKAKMEAEERKNSKEAVKREELVAKQKEIFKLMCGYVGMKPPYNEEEMFEGFDSAIKSIVGAAALVDCKSDVEKILDKVLG